MYNLFGDKEEHESYGMLSFSRIQCSRAVPLFGSKIKHRNMIRLSLSKAYVKRNLSEDWYYPNELLFEVDLSPSQFADLITSMNMNSGVPCTLKSIPSNRDIPECPFEDRSEIHRDEFKESMKDTQRYIETLIREVEEKFSKKTLNKDDKNTITSLLLKIKQNIGSNRDFSLKQFDRHMETTTTEAKEEIESFFQNRLNTIAQQALVEDPEKLFENMESPVELDTKED